MAQIQPLPEFVIWKLGRSVQNRPLDALAIAPQGDRELLPQNAAKASWPWVLFLGAVHGDEIEGVWLLEKVRELWAKSFPYKKVGAVVWAQVNPDGVALAQRWNAHQVDLNRNLPTKDWTAEIKNPRYPPGPSAASEPENKSLLRLIDDCAPLAILSAHSFSKYQVNSNGPSLEWAEALAKVCGYPVTRDIGYPTPGSLGTYAGAERQIPTITLEIERGLPKEKVHALHVPVIEAALTFWEKKTNGS